MDSPAKNQDTSDLEYTWDDYMVATKSEAAPSEAFEHVEHSLKSGFEVGMKLEIPNPEENNIYWIASVVVTCGELLTLRYLGDDRSGDFWLDTKTAEFHPVGWSTRNSKKLYPPSALLEKNPNIYALFENEVKEIQSVSALKDDLQAIFMPINQIKCDMKVEVSEDMNPDNFWIATISQNVGGRLLLCYDGCEHTTDNDFWLFYLSDRIYPVGHASDNGFKYSPPKAIKSKYSDEEWDKILQKSLEDSKIFPFPEHLLADKLMLDEHDFQEGMKLEAINPVNFNEICPATVSVVVNTNYFIVTIDSFTEDESTPNLMCCNSSSQTIFPMNWAEKNGLSLTVPKGFKVAGSKFSWEEYLTFCNATAAPVDIFNMSCNSVGLKVSQKLEAVDPLNHNDLYIATIEKVIEPVMYLRFDADPSRCVIEGINSLNVYPMGWCASNSYHLRFPVIKNKPKIAAANSVAEKEKQVSSEVKSISQTEQGKSWCPKIYFNHRCFTGPLLSKSKLAELPKAIGPGAVQLVMNEVISRVVNIAYKSSRVLQILQVQGKPTPGMQQQVIKAKYKGKSYRATIEVVMNSSQVEEFCKKICTKLECCSYLFGPVHVEETCPSNCSIQSKTKFGYNFVKKQKKPGRPPSVDPPTGETPEDSSEVVKKGPGRKKKRKHWTQLLAEAESHHLKNFKNIDSNDNKGGFKFKDANDSGGNDSPPSPKPNPVPRKKLKHIPSSSIVTRGAKLPNFGLWHHVTSFHSRRGRPRTRPLRPFPPRKVGRPVGSTKKALLAKKESEDENMSDIEIVTPEPPHPEIKCTLQSNPLDWSVDDVVKYIEETDCAPLAPMLREQEIDGQALLLLNLWTVEEFLNLRPEPAKKFCYILKSIKTQYFSFFMQNLLKLQS